MIENERKYLITHISHEKIEELKKKALKRVGIIQWYEDNDESEKRTRLTVYYDNIKGYTYSWGKNLKKATDDPQKRIEEEEALDPRKDVNLPNLESKKSVIKIRYIIKEDPEIVLDKFLTTDNSDNLESIKILSNEYYLEIEVKQNECDFEKELKNLNLQLGKDLEDVTGKKEHKNIQKAKASDLKPRYMIDYLQNKLKKESCHIKDIIDDKDNSYEIKDVSSLNDIEKSDGKVIVVESGKVGELFSNIKKIDKEDKSKAKKGKIKDFFVILSSGTFEWEKNENGSSYLNAKIKIGGMFSESPREVYIAIDSRARDVFEGKDLGLPSLGICEETQVKEFLSKNVNKVEIGAFRYIAGGGIPILELKNGKRYAILIRRDAKAPAGSECFTTPSGLSEYMDEWENPNLTIAREFYEEIQIFSSDLNIHYKPEFDFSKTKIEGNYGKFFEKVFLDYKHKLKGNYREFFEKVFLDYKYKLKRLEQYMDIPNVKDESVNVQIVPLGIDKVELEPTKGLLSRNRIITGQLVLDPILGALDLIGSVYIKFDNVESLDRLKIVDFDTVSQGKFLLREIHLIDGENLRKLIEGEDFHTSVFIRTHNGSRVVINYIEGMKYSKAPRLTTPLRGALVNCYNCFFSNGNPIGGFKESEWGSEHRLEPLHFPDQLEDYESTQNNSDIVNETERNTKISDEIFKTINDKSFHYWPSEYEVKEENWKENLNWKDHIKDMLASQSKDFKQIVKRFIEILDNFVLEQFTSLPYFTEHYSTHVRDVISNAFGIMNLRKEEFRELDYLILTLAALIHDLGQFNPQASFGKISVRDDPNLLEQYYKKLIAEFKKDKDYKKLFWKGPKEESAFAKLVLDIAKYHPKAMPLDKDYEDRFFEYIGRNIYHECLDEVLNKDLKDCDELKEDKKHFLLLAAILQIADGMDIQKYRNPSKESFKQKFAFLVAHKDEIRDDIRPETIKALIKDAMVVSTKVEENWIVFTFDKSIQKISKNYIYDRKFSSRSDFEDIFAFHNRSDFEDIFESAFKSLKEKSPKDLEIALGINLKSLEPIDLKSLVKDTIIIPIDLTPLIKDTIIDPTLKELALVDHILGLNGVKLKTSDGELTEKKLEEWKEENRKANGSQEVKDKKMDLIIGCRQDVEYRIRKQPGDKIKSQFDLELSKNDSGELEGVVRFDSQNSSENPVNKCIEEYVCKSMIDDFKNRWKEKVENRDLFRDEESAKLTVSKIWEDVIKEKGPSLIIRDKL